MTGDVLTAPRDLHFGGEGLWSHEEVTPVREDLGRRAMDASKLTFPLQLVVVIVGGIAATTGAFWLSTSTMRTDIAVIRQMQADQSKIDEFKSKLDEANRQILQQSVDAVKAELNAVRGQVQLANIEITNVRREMGERGVKR